MEFENQGCMHIRGGSVKAGPFVRVDEFAIYGSRKASNMF